MLKLQSKRFSILTLLLAAGITASAQTPRLETLDRGLIVAKGQTDGEYFASWRLLATDPKSTAFTLLRDGEPYKENITGATSLKVEGTPSNRWQVVTFTGGIARDTTKAVTAWEQPYLKYHLNKPEAGDGYDYTPNDCSVGDVDGDGQYELIVKWDPTNSRDNSGDGMTGPVFLDCYKFDMENPQNDPKQLWRISLGPNIRAGAHYTQFMVYDFDGDGRAELICKTAPGSKDGLGKYVNQASDNKEILSADNTKDWRNSRGRVAGGQEYLTVFDGRDGHAINTIFYEPNRNTTIGGDAIGTFNWNPGTDKKNIRFDDGNRGNRGERYLAAVAFLDGVNKNPCAIFTRGYYSYAFAWAVRFDGKHLKTKWLNESRSPKEYTVINEHGHKKTFTAAAPTSGSGSGTLYGNGNHNLSIADVDGDGRDEMLWGSAAVDDNGHMLYATGFGHGDAMHVADLNPSHPGLEVFDVHENRGPYSWDFHDAATGEVLLKGGPEGIDNGRGLAADIDSTAGAFAFWSAGDPNERSAKDGQIVSSQRLPINYRIYWDGDPQDELLDGVNIRKWTKDSTQMLGIWGTVQNPNRFRRMFDRMPRVTYANGQKGEGPDANAQNASRPERRGRRPMTRKEMKHEPKFFGEDTFQRPTISFNGYGTPASNNWTKNNPCLQADLFGDWREEVLYRDREDKSAIYIYMSQIPTTHRYVTLMHDHLYRMGIAWQNVAYNQPPHAGKLVP